MTAVIRGDALHIPLADNSVDLIVTSPPYFALRSYRDGGDHYSGQIGSEPTPQAFLEALWAVTKECWRVLKPSGSMFVNLGDKRVNPAGQGHLNKMPTNYQHERRWQMNRPFGRPKSKMALPHRYFIGCMDGLADPDGIGWIARQNIVWSKPNGLPESVTDRVRDSHEMWFHLTKQPHYFAAVDEVREASDPIGAAHHARYNEAAKTYGKTNNDRGDKGVGNFIHNPLGKLPGSVWTIPSEPLQVPEWLGVDHFAAFPQEWPRRLILGWSPTGICTVCGEGRRPVVVKMLEHVSVTTHAKTKASGEARTGNGRSADNVSRESATITGYGCACTPYTDHPGTTRDGPRNNGSGWAANTGDRDNPGGGYGNNPRTGPWREYHLSGWTPPPTRPAVVLDPFGGTGTVAMVARALGRTGISLDLSADYCRLATWRIFSSNHAAKTRRRTNEEAQGTFL